MIRKPEKVIPAGSACLVYDKNDDFVGTGFYNPRTDLALRMLGRERIDDPERELAVRLEQAIDYREKDLQLPKVTNGYRIIHGEADGFPGLLLDRLGDAVVGQLFSLCMESRMEDLGHLLRHHYSNCRLILTVDDIARKREGMRNLPPPASFMTEVREHGIRYRVEPGHGHKTGFFADQRDNRQRVRSLAKGRRVLDLCCNSGGFGLNAVKGGARSVLCADLDEAAIEQVNTNAKLNGMKLQAEHADAFDLLRDLRVGQYDLMILDPPKWARGKKEIGQGLRRYKDFNKLAFAKLEPGALCVTCSCSGAISEDMFLSTLREAAAMAGRDFRIRYLGGPGLDHPVALEVPETRYLKVLVLEVTRA